MIETKLKRGASLETLPTMRTAINTKSSHGAQRKYTKEIKKESNFVKPAILVRLHETGVNATHTKISVTGAKLAVTRTNMSSV